LDFIECSAFNALNISLVFEAIVRKVLRERTKKEKQEMETPLAPKVGSRTGLVSNEERKNRKEGGCC
jgi:GTPase SAR1 family protein